MGDVMKLIINHSTDPAFNLALEEYVLTRTTLDVIMLWRNKASVIIGRNQNAIEEMDMDFVRENGIIVIRRQSGGGAVFHDLGNINFTVIHGLGKNDFSNYEKFTAPVREFLQGLGVRATLAGRNDLVIDGAKFSGNAQAVKGERIMHHGTILYNANVEWLSGALKPKQAKIESKGIKSARERVTNVYEHLSEPMSVERFFDMLSDFFLARSDGLYELTDADIAATGELVEKKYSAWEWNIGHSPKYSHRKSERFTSGMIEVCLTVTDGVIRDTRIFGDFFSARELFELEARFNGIRHDDKEALREALNGIELNDYISGITPDEFLSLF